MGWPEMHRERGWTDREFFTRTLLAPHSTIVACSTIRNVFYAAVENAADAPHLPGTTWALVVMLRRKPGYYNFGYKAMTEFDGPSGRQSAAPAAVLDVLSPTTEEWAIAWRARCRRRIDDKRRVTRGTTVTFAEPMLFSDNVHRSVLRFVAGSTFTADGGVLVRIPDWLDRAYVIGAAEPVAAG